MSELNEKKVELDLYEMEKDVSIEEETAPAESTASDAEPVEAPVEAEASETEPEQENVPAEEPVEIPVDEYKLILDEHFQNLRALIKYTKTKDETIQKLSNELQKYREDYCAKTFKSIATLLISFREDCRKSIADLDNFKLTLDKVKKFMSFLCDDYEELLSNAGCEEDDGVWSFNGKPLCAEERAVVTFPAVFELSEPAEDTPDMIVGNNIKEYLVSAENGIKQLLADNTLLDKCMKDYCTLSSVIEQDVVLLCVYPSVRRLISVFEKTKQSVEDRIAELNEENMIDSYRATLTFLVDQMEDILLSGGVRVETSVDDTFDTKKNRLIRAVVTDVAELDRKIAKQHTECYMMNDSVIYPAKVDVYKYQA